MDIRSEYAFISSFNPLNKSTQTMAQFARNPASCGGQIMFDLHSIDTNRREGLAAFKALLRGETYFQHGRRNVLPGQTNSVGIFHGETIIFSDTVGGAGRHIADFITRHNLGELVRTSTVRNPNTTNQIITWMWVYNGALVQEAGGITVNETRAEIPPRGVQLDMRDHLVGPPTWGIVTPVGPAPAVAAPDPVERGAQLDATRRRAAAAEALRNVVAREAAAVPVVQAPPVHLAAAPRLAHTVYNF